MQTQQEKMRLGRISVKVRIGNLLEPDHVLTCDALVDTGSAYMVLPRARKDRLGSLPTVRYIDCETATQHLVKGEVPDRWDWREHAAAGSLSPIRNQGSCGSCWAFGTAGVFEQAIAIYNKILDLEPPSNLNDKVNQRLALLKAVPE